MGDRRFIQKFGQILVKSTDDGGTSIGFGRRFGEDQSFNEAAVELVLPGTEPSTIEAEALAVIANAESADAFKPLIAALQSSVANDMDSAEQARLGILEAQDVINAKSKGVMMAIEAAGQDVGQLEAEVRTIKPVLPSVPTALCVVWSTQPTGSTLW